MKRNEISLTEIFRIIKRRKNILILTVILSTLAALLYNFFKKPVYRSSVLLKKEQFVNNTSSNPDQVKNIIIPQSQDVLETEMELVKTRKVFNSVIEKLSLNVFVNKITFPDGKSKTLNESLMDYQRNYEYKYDHNLYPKINTFYIGVETRGGKFVAKNNNENSFEIIESQKEAKIKNSKKYSELDPKDWIVDIEWPNMESKAEIYFETKDYHKILDRLDKTVGVSKRIKTNIFEISVEAQSPYKAKTIANTIADVYREQRLGLQKDNIHTSFKFIDDQLKKISLKLEDAENELSNFKAKEKIITVDKRSQSLIEFLSKLEAEKLKTDLDLTLYRTKVKNISKEVTREGYVDQTYLTPEKYQSTDSPFSNLMKELTTLELKRIQLLQRRKEIHPDVVLLTEQINKVKKELSKYNHNTVTAFNIMINALKEKQSNLNELIKKYSVDLTTLPEQENQLASLLRHKNVFEKMFKLLLNKREEMRISELSKIQDIVVLDYADEPIKPISPNKKLNLLLGALFGFLVGFIAMFAKEFTNKEVNDVYEIERKFDFPILSVIPPYNKTLAKSITNTESISGRFVTMMEDKLNYKEAFRTFETKLSTLIPEKTKKVMITSCEENAGKSTAAANLAITVAQSGKKVLLIDCDIKKPSIAELFGLPKYSSGLIDYLTEKTETPNIYKPIKLTKNSNLLMNLDIIPTGVFSNISGEILASERMKKLIDNLNNYDFIILDTPPVTRLSDALSLGRIIKKAVLVIRPGQTVQESINWVINELKSSGVKFLGALVNDCEVKKDDYKYQYGYMEKS